MSMWETFRQPLRAALLSALVVGLLIFFLNPPSLSGAEGMLRIVVGAILIILFTAWLTVLAIGREMPEPEFRKLVDRSEALAAMRLADTPPTDFDELVMAALDDLPPRFQELLEHTPVLISNRGREHRAYGLYMGDTMARDNYPDRIVIYQDTLERDFGHNPDLLRAQVERTVRHEISHHLGWDEEGVRNLGL
jgi:predicted Zn-dependent protease with MMP-like domain